MLGFLRILFKFVFVVFFSFSDLLDVKFELRIFLSLGILGEEGKEVGFEFR